MPIYEYQCNKCSQVVEVLQKLSDPAPKCAACGAETHRQMSQTSFVLKGSGWYITDYARKGKTDSDSSGSSSSSSTPSTPSTSGGGTSGESK